MTDRLPYWDDHKTMRTPNAKPEHVYFISDDESQAIKMGASAGPELRIESLQTGNPHKLRLVKVIENGGITLEREFRELFRDAYLDHDWFRLTPEIRDYLGQDKENNKEIKLDDGFKTFLPPLLDEQRKGLEQDILKRGCLSPLVLWDGVLLEGYHRYEICRTQGIPFNTVSLKFDTKMDALFWLFSHHRNRRNMSKYEVTAKALMFGPKLEQEAKKQKQKAGGLYHRGKGKGKVFSNEENLSECHVDEQLAELVGVSTGTIHKVRNIEEKATPEQKQSLAEGVATINQVFVTIKREEIKQAVKESKWPDGKYRVIYADPPWQYSNSQPDYQTVQDDHYPTIPPSEICALPVSELSLDNAVLFLWATSPILEDAFKVVNAWGFKYRASFIWDKVRHNMGHYNSVRHEFLLIAVRGSCQPDILKLFDSVQTVERTDHSTKPEVFRTIIDTLYPYGKRIELFARAKVDGWEQYGNQIS